MNRAIGHLNVLNSNRAFLFRMAGGASYTSTLDFLRRLSILTWLL